MIFRDESIALSAKRQRKANAKTSRSSASTTSTISKTDKASSSGSDTDNDSSKALLNAQVIVATENPTPSFSFISPDLVTSADDQASCFFFRNYVLEEHRYNNGNFQYLSDIYGCQQIGTGLADCVTALGMAGLANFWKSPNIMVNANMKYNSALRQISSRLRDIEQAKSDQTLVTVMLLGLYEVTNIDPNTSSMLTHEQTNTCSGPQSMKSWTKHINGAAALLHLRGKEQLATPIGRNLFVHLRTQVVSFPHCSLVLCRNC
jgi:hypothetical protein